ncbi:unnamed protein product [Echinostoma caproni]|uniref:TIR domain-containing protein n=1 Tax=Echinostoma caproni TaxID=27848 RepID=A0A183B6U3_9TREM|nr:unnamed protein product [Echinostoma caproni]
MDLVDALGPDFVPTPLSHPRLTLVLSHGLADHESVLCDIAGRLTRPVESSMRPSVGGGGDTNSTSDSHSPHRCCLFIAVQKPADLYQRMISRGSKLLRATTPDLQFVDVSSWLQSMIRNIDLSTADQPVCLSFADQLSEHLKEQVSY